MGRALAVSARGRAFDLLPLRPRDPPGAGLVPGLEVERVEGGRRKQAFQAEGPSRLAREGDLQSDSCRPVLALGLDLVQIDRDALVRREVPPQLRVDVGLREPVLAVKVVAQPRQEPVRVARLGRRLQLREQGPDRVRRGARAASGEERRDERDRRGRPTQFISSSSLPGRGGKDACGSCWYQYATDAMSSCNGR